MVAAMGLAGVLLGSFFGPDSDDSDPKEVAYAKEVLKRGDIDEVSGTYAYFSTHHRGQSSAGYEALSILGKEFEPGPMWSESRLEESEVDAYNEAVRRFGGKKYKRGKR